jgi:hypothetical protein
VRSLLAALALTLGCASVEPVDVVDPRVEALCKVAITPYCECAGPECCAFGAGPPPDVLSRPYEECGPHVQQTCIATYETLLASGRRTLVDAELAMLSDTLFRFGEHCPVAVPTFVNARVLEGSVLEGEDCTIDLGFGDCAPGLACIDGRCTTGGAPLPPDEIEICTAPWPPP